MLRRAAFFSAVVLIICASAFAAENVTLEFWDWPHMPPTNAHIAESIAQFERDNPGVNIRYTRIPWQDGQQKVMLSVNSGRPPDICGQVNVSPWFIAQDVLEPWNDYLKEDLHDYHESYIEGVSHRGKIYALPWYKACYVMVLDLDQFAIHGVEPPKNGRWTWHEFTQKMQALTKLDPLEKKQYYGLVTNLGPMEYEAYSIIFNAGGRIVKPDAKYGYVSALTEPGFIEGLSRLVDLEYNLKVCRPSMGALTQEQSWAMWRDSKSCAVTIQGAWSIAALRSGNEEIERSNAIKKAAGRTNEMRPLINWMIAAPPSDGDTTPVLGSSGMGTYVLFKKGNGRKRDLGAKFIKFLTSGKGQEILREENVYPSRKSAGNPYADDPVLGPVFELFPAGIMSPLIPGGERIDAVMQPEIQKALLRNPATGQPQATPEAAAKAAEKKVEAVLERARRRFALQ